MTVTAAQINAALDNGMRSAAVDAAATGADRTGASFYQVLALIAKESTNGANVYGNDVGGTFRGFKDEVSEANWRAFRHEVLVNGRPSNGVGPVQLTYRGYFTDMETQGLRPWLPADSIPYGVELYWGYYRRARGMGYSHSSGVKWAGTWYNAGADETVLKQPYADTLLTLANKWRGLVGIDDTVSR